MDVRAAAAPGGPVDGLHFHALCPLEVWSGVRCLRPGVLASARCSPLVGYATVRGGLQRTLDGGIHWSSLHTPGT